MSARGVRQTTLGDVVRLEGIGVHTGAPGAVALHPAMADAGIVFRRRGQPGGARARIADVSATDLCTTLAVGGWSVGTVEHLLAALSGLEVDNAIVEVEGPEVPAMDGSAAAFVAAIDRAGIEVLDSARTVIRVTRPVRVENGQSVAEFRPYDGRRLELELDYRSPVIGRQRFAADVTPGVFRRELAAARTFGFFDEVEGLRQRGLARGASLDNALVIGEGGLMNAGGLRFADEFVRHKALDAIGDLALAGAPILGLYRSFRGGHGLNARAVSALLATPDAFERVVLARRPAAVRIAEPAVAVLAPERS